MKKVVTMLLCAVLLVSLLAVSVFAAEPYHFTITADTTEPVVAGQEIKFTVKVEGTTDCDIMGLQLNYDKDVFELVKGVCNPSAEDEDGVTLVLMSDFNEGFAISFKQALTYSGRVGYVILKVKDGASFESTTVTGTPSVKIGATDLTATVDTVTVTAAATETEPTTAPTEPACAHNWVEYAAVEPTCDTEGNVAYKRCSICGEAWTLGENPVPLGLYGWVLGPTGHTFENHEAVEPSCGVEGNIAYQQCSVCGYAQTWEENPMPLGLYGWILGALEHDWVEYEAVEPGCNWEGNIAYKRCKNCGEAWTLDANPMPLGLYGWVLGPTGEHTMEHHDAVEATCETDGHYAYDYCTTCECYFYEDPLMLTWQAGVIPAGHTWENFEAVAPSCGVEGNLAYQRCTVCGYAQTWEENPIPLGLYGWVLGALEHDWVEYEAVEPGCNWEGNIAYKRCNNCGEAWTLGENPMPLSLYGWVLGPTGEHTMEHHDYVAPTCYENGHYAFDYCTTCECFFYEDPLMLTFYAGIIPAAHTWVNHEAVAPTCFEPGNVAYQQCSVCGAAQTWEENPMPLGLYGWILGPAHNIQHVEAVAPTYTSEGNIEYWYCADCGYAWTDENLTQVTNLLSVILPALENPNTGDETPVVALIALTTMAACGLALVVANKKKFVA